MADTHTNNATSKKNPAWYEDATKFGGVFDTKQKAFVFKTPNGEVTVKTKKQFDDFKKTACIVKIEEIETPAKPCEVTEIPKGKLENSDMAYVKSNTYGALIYENRRTHEVFIWEKCGEIMPLYIETLKDMKMYNPGFFRENRILVIGVDKPGFTAQDVYDLLMVSQYYKNGVDFENFRDLCNLAPNEIENTVSAFPTSVKENLVIALNELIDSGELDSFSKIRAFERALGCSLREME